MSAASFAFPEIHSFPPFYTRQLHEETWQKQKDLWIETIMGYCAARRIFEISLNDEGTFQWPLFYNSQIDRKMDGEFLQELFDEMVKSEKAAWLPPLTRKSSILVYWRRPSEWSQLIYKFVERTGGIGSIFTVYDLIEGDDSVKEEFHQLPENFMKIVVADLERTGKARLFTDASSTNFKESGLKFF